MAKVTYKDGDTTQFGYEFAGGKPVDVTDEKHLRKFRGNPFFEVTEDKAATIDGKPAPKGPFEAKEKGGGWWAIFDADGNEVGKSIRGGDAEAFNSMTDDDKAAYVADL